MINRDDTAVLLQRQELKKFYRFLVVGISNTVISFMAYYFTLTVLPNTLGMASLAQTISYCAGIFWSYFWNRIWVFESSDHVVKEGWRFLTVQLSLMLLSAALIGLLVDLFKVDHVWAWVVVMGFITVLNYGLLRLWTFRSSEATLGRE